MAGIKNTVFLKPGNEIVEKIISAMRKRFGKDFSLYEISKKINEHQGVIKDSLQAKNAFRQATILYKLCAVCNITIDELFNENYKPETENDLLRQELFRCKQELKEKDIKLNKFEKIIKLFKNE